MTAVIAITSGKSKVGKTLLSTNLAQYLNQKGHRTGLVVAGAGQPVWGIAPDTTWPNILGGRLALDRAIHSDIFGIDLIVARGHGHALVGLSTQNAQRLDDPKGILDAYAYLLVDITAGISTPALACCLAATETLLVLTPDTPTLSATFEWLVLLARHDFSGPVNIILNQIRKPVLAQSIYLRFRDLTQKRLKIQTNLWGTMNLEENIDPGNASRHPLVQIMPQSKLLRDIHVIGDRLAAEQPPENQTRPLKAFWQHFVERLQQLPTMPAPLSGQTRERVEPEPLEQPLPVPTELIPSINKTLPDGPSAQTLSQLSAQFADIAHELSAIRRLLESRTFGEATSRKEKGASPCDPLKLNFDAFIDRRQKNGGR